MTKNIFKNILCTILTMTLFVSLSVIPAIAADFQEIDIDFEDDTLGVISTDVVPQNQVMPEIVNVAKGADINNKALKLGSSWSGSIATGLPMGNDGIYEISFSMMSNSTEYQAGQVDRDKTFVVFLNKGTTNAAIIKNGYIRQSLDAASSWNGNGGMFAVTAGEWLDVKLIINTKTNTVVSATYTQGAKTQTVENISLGSHDYTTIYLYNNATTASYVDDIKVKPYTNDEDDEIPVVVNGVIDFEDNTLTGVAGMNATTPVTIPKDTNVNNKALKLENSFTGTIATGITANSGIYEISFSMYPETITGNNAVFFKDKTQAAVLVTYTNNNYVKQSIDTSNGAWNAKWVFDSKIGEWIDVKLIIDTATDTVTSATYTQGTKSVTVTQTAANEKLSVSAANYSQLNLFGTDGDSCYIDDISIKKIIHDPELSKENIEIIDVYGNIIFDNNGILTSAIDKITFNFNTEIVAGTLEDITFKDIDGNIVDATSIVEAESGLYIYDINGFLKPDKTYIITIPGTVKNVNEVELGEEFIYEFKTEAGAVMVETLSLCDQSGIEFNDIEEISSSNNVIANVRYLNTSEQNSEFVCIISYYRNGFMAYSKVSDTYLVDKTSKGEVTVNFEIPRIQGITDVRFFVIDNNINGVPMGNVFNPFTE